MTRCRPRAARRSPAGSGRPPARPQGARRDDPHRAGRPDVGHRSDLDSDRRRSGLDLRHRRSGGPGARRGRERVDPRPCSSAGGLYPRLPFGGRRFVPASEAAYLAASHRCRPCSRSSQVVLLISVSAKQASPVTPSEHAAFVNSARRPGDRICSPGDTARFGRFWRRRANFGRCSSD